MYGTVTTMSNHHGVRMYSVLGGTALDNSHLSTARRWGWMADCISL